MCSCTSPAGRLESHQRGFWIETLVLCPGDLLSKSSNFFQKKVVGGQPPVNDRRVGGKHNTVKQADSGLGGWMLRKFQGEPLKPDHVLAFCQASFRMTLSWVRFLTLAPDNNPLHCSCLENPGDGGAWWAAGSRREESRRDKVMRKEASQNART